MRNSLILITALVALAAVSTGCGPKKTYLRGTRVVDTPVNRELIELLETYRLAVEAKDAPALILMASPDYWEDGGTTAGKDDYGYKKLRTVLTGRFQKSRDLRYSMRYMNIAKRCPPNSDGRDGCRAYVDVLIDASYSVDDARGEETRLDKRDQNQLVLEWNGDAWKIISGM